MHELEDELAQTKLELQQKEKVLEEKEKISEMAKQHGTTASGVGRPVMSLSCEKCGLIDVVALGYWDSRGYYIAGRIHKAIPESHDAISSLLAERRTGWNTYAPTFCHELHE